MSSAGHAVHRLGAAEAARAIRGGDLDSQTLVQACLYRIAQREPDVMAWAHLDAEAALGQARARDREAPIGLLHGVPLAFGTQTVGSTIRPAAFCGIVGYKPSFGLVNRAGLKFSAESFDTIGLLGRNVADVGLLAQAVAGVAAIARRDVRGLRIGLCQGAFREVASGAARARLEEVAQRLSDAGAIVSEFEPAWADEGLREAHQAVMLHGLARASLWEYQHHRERLSERFRINVEKGLAISIEAWQRSIQLIRACRHEMAAVAATLDGVLTFAAPGEAPEGLSSTGDSVFNRIWTALAVPCLSLPAGIGEKGLPLAVQWVGFEGQDAETLAAAAAIEAVLAGRVWFSKRAASRFLRTPSQGNTRP